ncbi:MAG TPA: serine/threonine-protein kinase [Gemmata sp.]|jgi:serine/threonine protein kinase|nr:serine/threonine-protein kinase [Gemmata sp.]
MSFNFDATGIGQFAIRLGLVTEEQVRECLLELEDRKAPGPEMLRLLERKRYLTPWQSGKLKKGDTDGYFLGGYRLLYKIASGSFGRVYRGDDPRTGQVVAIKVLRNKWTMDKQKVELFQREGKLGMSIRHPNIVSVLAVNQDNVTNQFFLVMEFIEGGNLRDLLQIRRPLGTDEALRIMEECTHGLAYSHARGLTHRDIKPTNILIVAATMQAKLVDFGLAEISAGSSVHLQRQQDRDEDVAVDRTVDYAGLEKATNQKPGDVRTDIYFLGSVLYECLTGHPLMPVTRDRQARMQARRYQEVEETLQKTGPAYGLKPPVMALISKMVAYEPGSRFQTPTQLVEAIQTCRATLQEVQRSANPRTPSGQKTVFALEAKETLKDHIRDRFKERGYRVLMSSDPEQALKRYQEQPYHALIVNAGSIGKEGIRTFNRVLRESDAEELDLAAVLILDRKQSDWASDAVSHARGAVLFLPLKMKDLIDKVEELTPVLKPQDKEEDE